MQRFSGAETPIARRRGRAAAEGGGEDDRGRILELEQRGDDRADLRLRGGFARTQERNVAEELLVGRCVASIGSSRSGAANGDPLAAWDKRAKSGLRAFLFLAEAVK